jgi:hypothetical protein
VVQKGQTKTVNGKIKDMAPVGVVGLLFQLVVRNHDTRGDKVRDNGTSKYDQNVLRDPSPRGMARTEERRLPNETRLALEEA